MALFALYNTLLLIPTHTSLVIVMSVKVIKWHSFDVRICIPMSQFVTVDVVDFCVF